MLRASSQLCPFCEVRSIFSLRSPAIRPAQWQQSRSMMMKRRPSRMILSPSVSQAPPRITEKKRPKRRIETPFAGLNKTKTDIEPPSTSKQQPEGGRTPSVKPKFGSTTRRREEPFKALKMQRALAPVSYGQRNAIKDKIREIEAFGEFPLLPTIQESISTQALPGMEDVTPTPVQRVAIPALLGTDAKRTRTRGEAKPKEMEQFLLAAETGSGKTLAYLLPVMDQIKRAELKEKEQEAKHKAQQEAEEAEKKKRSLFELPSPPVDAPDPTTGRPRAIVLVPTAELVAQVGLLAKAFAHTVKFKVAPISSALTGKVIRNRLFSPSGVDIVVSTPHLLASIAESDPNILSRVTHLVIDEADSLLDRSFSPLTSEIIERSAPSLKQLIMCSATIPRSLDSHLRKRFPDIKRLVTPNLHAIPRRVQLGVVDVNKEPYRGNKDLACADTIWNIGRSHEEHTSNGKEDVYVKRIIVFVNEREKSVELADFLVSKGVDAIAINRDTAGDRQSKLLATFTSSTPEAAPATDPDAPKTPNYVPPQKAGTIKRQLPNTKVLVTTDLGSRGIDTLAVRHVVLYDVPHTTIDFIHRLGRVGRMGRRGRGIVLMGKGDRADVVKEVREGMYKGQALI